MHILHRETRVSWSSFFALGSQIIALPFPAFSEYFHLQLELGIGLWEQGRIGRAYWGLGIQRLTSFLQTLQSFLS